MATVAFDFDGVIADSVEVKTKAFAKLFETHGSEIEAQVVEHHRENGGMTRKDKFQHYYTEFLKTPIDDAEIERLCSTFSSMVVEEVIAATEIAGVRSFLEKWHRKIPCYVVSATPDDEIRLIVERKELDTFFCEVLGSSRSKTENLEYLLGKFSMDPLKCLFFGDAASDYQAAIRCNIPFVGILPGTRTPLLEAYPNIKWFRDFTELQL